MKHMWVALAAACGLAWGSAQAESVVGFSGDFAPANWAPLVGTNGASPLMDASFLSITSPKPLGFDFSETSISILVGRLARVSFSWAFETSDGDDDPFYDPFGVITANGHQQLTDDDGALSQGGNASFIVGAGEVFGFYAQAIDGDFGTATTRVGNFRVDYIPEPASLLLMAAALAAATAARRRQAGRV